MFRNRFARSFVLLLGASELLVATGLASRKAHAQGQTGNAPQTTIPAADPTGEAARSSPSSNNPTTSSPVIIYPWSSSSGTSPKPAPSGTPLSANGPSVNPSVSTSPSPTMPLWFNPANNAMNSAQVYVYPWGQTAQAPAEQPLQYPWSMPSQPVPGTYTAPATPGATPSSFDGALPHPGAGTKATNALPHPGAGTGATERK